MLRALFVLLAVVSFVLAIVLAMPELYVVAGILVVIAIVMVAASARRRHRKASQPYTATAERDSDGELAALGISEIRPRERKRDDRDLDVVAEPDPDGARVVQDSAVVGADDVRGGRGSSDAANAIPKQESPSQERETQPPDAELRALGIMDIRPRSTVAAVSEPLPPAAQEASSDHANGREARSARAEKSPKKKSPPTTDAEFAARERLRKEVLTPYLQAVQAAVGANTVCLLRQDDAALRYHIEAIVSKNAYARSQGHFSVRVPLLTPAASQRAVVTFRIGEKGIAGSNLGYYMEAIAVRQVAVADVPQQSYSSSYFLLADSMEEGGVGAPAQHALLSQFARSLGTILDGGEQPSAGDAEMRPRRDIIDEEMKRAREERRALALVLVYLNHAEEIAAEGIESVDEAEAILEGKLREAVEDRRVEHFGELIYAVFYEGEAAQVEPWVMELQERLHEPDGPLHGGVSIGIAVLGDRHQSPDDFRHDATEALREAYETGACTILE